MLGVLRDAQRWTKRQLAPERRKTRKRRRRRCSRSGPVEPVKASWSGRWIVSPAEPVEWPCWPTLPPRTMAGRLQLDAASGSAGSLPADRATAVTYTVHCAVGRLLAASCLALGVSQRASRRNGNLHTSVSQLALRQQAAAATEFRRSCSNKCDASAEFGPH